MHAKTFKNFKKQFIMSGSYLSVYDSLKHLYPLDLFIKSLNLSGLFIFFDEKHTHITRLLYIQYLFT